MNLTPEKSPEISPEKTLKIFPSTYFMVSQSCVSKHTRNPSTHIGDMF
jgi:hypothetical protein